MWRFDPCFPGFCHDGFADQLGDFTLCIEEVEGLAFDPFVEKVLPPDEDAVVVFCWSTGSTSVGKPLGTSSAWFAPAVLSFGIGGGVDGWRVPVRFHDDPLEHAVEHQGASHDAVHVVVGQSDVDEGGHMTAFRPLCFVLCGSLFTAIILDE